MIRNQMALCLISGLLSMGVGNCSHSNMELCTKDFPRFLERLEKTRVALEKSETEQKRKPSSNSLSLEEREHWKKWALEELIKTESHIDDLEEDPRFIHVIPEVNAIANEFVSLYGLSEQGDVDQMRMILEKINIRQQQAQRKLCQE